ncbi:response regulator [Desulfobacterales bacterium HSG2]|nr:response regulator [Desulfobacterales bacterium HSG2]
MNIRDMEGSTILIVDDNPENLGVLFEYLSKAGFNVLVAQSGEDALELVRENMPGIILLDILMPGIDGFETCRRLKANRETKDIPVLFVSSLSDTVDKVRGFDVGGVDYVTKPFKQEEVLARITTHLSLYNLRKALEEKNVRLQQEILERNRAETALRKSEKKYRTLVEAADDAILLLDTEFRHLFENTAYYAGLGYKKGDVLPDDFSRIHPDDLPAVRENITELFETGKAESEYRIRHRKGHWVHRFAKSVLIYDDDKKPEAILSIIRDISNRKQMEEELRHAKEAAEAANRAKSEFLANMSHDIRTPMNAILGFTEILEGEIRDEQQKRHLSSIKSGGKSLLGLINDILDLSKIEAGKLKPEYSAVNLHTLLKDMEQIFSHKIFEKGLEFRIETEPDLPKMIITDETRLRQIFMNLMGNAVKFTDSGHVKLSVNHCCFDEKQSRADILFSVEDTGIGIPQDQQESVFSAFEQQKGQSHAKFGGTGLGLAITKHLTEMMGGEIRVASQVGKGSAFLVIFRDVDIVHAPESDEKEETDIGSVIFEEAAVLLADDVELNRVLIKSYFSDHPEIRIIEAENGKTALELAERHRPDLILMDMKMPVMDGYEATRMIKADEVLRHIPVIALTADAIKENVTKIMDICDDYTAKPVSKAELISVLTKFLKHSAELTHK